MRVGSNPKTSAFKRRLALLRSRRTAGFGPPHKPVVGRSPVILKALKETAQIFKRHGLRPSDPRATPWAGQIQFARRHSKGLRLTVYPEGRGFQVLVNFSYPTLDRKMDTEFNKLSKYGLADEDALTKYFRDFPRVAEKIMSKVSTD